ncbi:hypothetical protein ASD38_16530 [Caulobacter sp. Root487D2Y]|nr:hypothetical protein ASD38_16530 [Caulobacter sp. Root487D2Y]
MSPPRAPQRATLHAPKPPRVYRRDVKRLTRVRLYADPESKTLFFTTPGGGSGNSRSTFIAPDNVPPFEGEEAWFEMELVEGKPWSFWRAVRQVEPPADA